MGKINLNFLGLENEGLWVYLDEEGRIDFGFYFSSAREYVRAELYDVLKCSKLKKSNYIQSCKFTLLNFKNYYGNVIEDLKKRKAYRLDEDCSYEIGDILNMKHVVEVVGN